MFMQYTVNYSDGTLLLSVELVKRLIQKGWKKYFVATCISIYVNHNSVFDRSIIHDDHEHILKINQ